MRNQKIILLFAAVFVTFCWPATPYAQLNNKPFSFKMSPGGGVGMSLGGRQAIINQKVLGVTPGTLVRGADGQLLDVTKGPGKSAIISHEGGGTIPSFRGRSFRGGNVDMAVGVFNSFFSSRSGGGSSGSSIASVHSAAVVDTWTGRVVTGGMPVSYLPSSSVDNWTALAYSMN